MKVPFLLHSFLTLATLTVVYWYPIIILVCISLMIMMLDIFLCTFIGTHFNQYLMLLVFSIVYCWEYILVSFVLLEFNICLGFAGSLCVCLLLISYIYCQWHSLLSYSFGYHVFLFLLFHCFGGALLQEFPQRQIVVWWVKGITMDTSHCLFQSGLIALYVW